MNNIILKRLKQACIYFYFLITFKKYNNSIHSLKKNWIIFTYLKNKYTKYLNKLPKYESTNKFSNKIWWCWLQGEENAPSLNKACLSSLRKNLPDREIIVITNDNYKNYVDFPEHIIKKYNNGIISRTHFSDLLRTSLLVKHGGTWIDSSVLCTEYYKDFFDKNLFVFSNWNRANETMVLSSWFITSEVQNPILKTTQDLLFKYWEDHNYILNYFLFHFFFTIVTEKYANDWKKVNRFSNLPPHILQFELTEKYSKERFEQIKKMSAFHKLNQKLDFSMCDGSTNYDFILKEYGDNNE